MLSVRDSLEFLSRLTFRKLWNAARLFVSFYFSRLTKQTAIPVMPITFSVEPTTSCNLGCPECPSGLKQFTRPVGEMEEELYRKLVDELANDLLYLYFYFQGEPYLHPRFTELVRYAADKRIYTVTSTNAHFLTERKAEETVRSGLSRILISVDGTTQETYSQYRIHGSLDKVLEGTRRLVEARKRLRSSTPHIVWQFLVVRHNEHQVQDAKQMAKALGVDDIRFKTAQIHDYHQGHPLIPTTETFSRYRQKTDGSWEIKNKLENQCWKLWHSAVMTWDGKIVPCCFDKDAQYTMGNMQQQTFRQIWNSEPYHAFRQRLLQSRKAIDICTNCSEGTTVWETPG